MPQLCFIDTETRSQVDLKKSGVYRYVEDADFAVLMAAYSFDGGPVRIALGHEEIAALYVPGVRYVAHNAGFDRIVLGQVDARWLDPEQWDDTAARAAEAGLPRSLSNLASALGCTPKDTAGTRLINLFCKPHSRKRNGEKVWLWNTSQSHPVEWAAFIAYCLQDVETMIEAEAKLPGWPSPTERRAWVLDQRINDRGLRVDIDLARAGAAAAQVNQQRDGEAFTELTGAGPRSNPDLKAWAEREGLNLPNFQADTVRAALDSGELTAVQRAALELKVEMSASSTAKFTAALAQVNADGRVRGSFRFFGAHTGRWSGSGVQFQNLPRVSSGSDEEVDAAIADLHACGEADTLTLKRLIRPMVVGPFTVVDFAQIEARVLAWLADETWVLDAFRGQRDLYVETAERMSKPERPMTRQDGKTAVLALGYGGGTPALRRMGADGTDEELRPLVDAWREANPRIVKLWKATEDRFAEGGMAGRLRVQRHLGSMELLLPSGRTLRYFGVRHEDYTVPNADPLAPPDAPRIRKRGWRYTQVSAQGGRIGFWGGPAVQNATQAVARDLLTEAMLRLEERGYRLLGHVHDEVIIAGEHDVEEVVAVMTETPAWAEGLPIGAEGFTTYRYKK